jgi:formyl-CoA transferase
VTSLTGTPAEPAKVGISIADIAGGMYAYTGILTALYRRATTGEAVPVEVSLFDALSEWMGAPAYYTGYGGSQPPRAGMEHATIAPYGPFTAADGGTVLLAIQNEREWVSFCAVFLGDPAVATDERFAGNPARVAHRDELRAVIADRFAGLTADAATALLDAARVANARVNSVAEYLDHPVLAERDRWREIDTPNGPIRALLPPATLRGIPARLGPVPAVGEHTDAILTELGYTAEEIAGLRADGCV